MDPTCHHKHLCKRDERETHRGEGEVKVRQLE